MKQSSPGIHAVTIVRQGIKDIYITVYPRPGEELPSIVDRLICLLQEQDAKVVKFDVFGAVDQSSLFMHSLKDRYGKVDWPVTWVEGSRHSGGNLAGIQVHAVSGVPVETIFLGAKPAARVFEDGFARYCILGNVLPDGSLASQEEQARQVLEKIEKALKLAGMDMSDLVRTWFYNDDILGWYDVFNTTRTRFFKQSGVSDKLLPASSAIGGKNPANAALVASAVAIKARKRGVTVREVPSSRQLPPSKYGSSFSRAVEIILPDYRCLLVSGTASVGADGKTVHGGDIDAQIAFTMEAVEAILESRGLGYPDVTRAIAYFKRPKDIPAFDEYREKRGKCAIPAATMLDDICRGDLLFEIEVDAVSKI